MATFDPVVRQTIETTTKLGVLPGDAISAAQNIGEFNGGTEVDPVSRTVWQLQ